MNLLDSIARKTGDLRQVAGTRAYALTEGAAAGVRAIDVNTGGGLTYTVLPDRGMDISLASFRGVNLCYQSGCGEAHPAFYDAAGDAWLRVFHAGLLTTCGPTNIAPACVDEGETLGLHGRCSATPAFRFADESDWEGDAPRLSLRGEMRFASVFGERLRLVRRISSAVFENRICLEDTIVNEGGTSAPFAMLYHVNAGYPLLDEDARIRVSSETVEGYDEYSQAASETWRRFRPPDAGNREKNYLHRFCAKCTSARAEIENPRLGLRLYVAFDPRALPFMTQWKMEGVRDYVMALEPGNAPCEARDVLRKKGLLPRIEPGQRVVHRLEIGVEGAPFTREDILP